MALAVATLVAGLVLATTYAMTDTPRKDPALGESSGGAGRDRATIGTT
jgi:hypothetical protein